MAMNTNEAAAVVATLPIPAGLSLSISGDWITFDGPTGPHSLSIMASTPDRVRIHWNGYVEIATGIKLAQPGSHVLCPSPAKAIGKTEPEVGGSVTVHAGGIWRRVKVLRVTPKRVQVEFYYKYCYDRHGRLIPGCLPCVRWYKRSEVKL